mmetsp:Transcript_33569/g.99951  ORF Transcript_33569/g.99951 Transcript_33569/m.99951 type:complete len:235 (+) Transcript_33569:1387-2091(+)
MLNMCCCAVDANTMRPPRMSRTPESPRLAMCILPFGFMTHTQMVELPGMTVSWCAWRMTSRGSAPCGCVDSCSAAAANLISEREYSAGSMPSSAQPDTPSATPMAPRPLRQMQNASSPPFSVLSMCGIIAVPAMSLRSPHGTFLLFADATAAMEMPPGWPGSSADPPPPRCGTSDVPFSEPCSMLSIGWSPDASLPALVAASACMPGMDGEPSLFDDTTPSCALDAALPCLFKA